MAYRDFAAPSEMLLVQPFSLPTHPHPLVSSYSNPEIVERLHRERQISFDEAQQLFDDLKKFLYLCGTRTGAFVPTREIDKAWHTFIIYTEAYANFCEQMFGRFIHHRPKSFFMPESDSGSVKDTRQIAEMLFGPLSANWSNSVDALCSSGGSDDRDCCGPGGGADE